ncbi:MAG: ComEA family DNA-binding protein [Smithellaceae bacterium]
MSVNQIRGLIVIFIILTIIPFTIFFCNYSLNNKIPFLATQHNNTLVVDIRDKAIDKGIYFVPVRTTAKQLLEMTGIDAAIEKDFMLENGMKLSVDSDAAKRISWTEIDNARRLALGMPINLNRATEEDLILIPGIGEITAQKILMLRSKKLYFKNIEELTELKGIKEKKLAKLKQYLYLQK